MSKNTQCIDFEILTVSEDVQEGVHLVSKNVQNPPSTMEVVPYINPFLVEKKPKVYIDPHLIEYVQFLGGVVNVVALKVGGVLLIGAECALVLIVKALELGGRVLVWFVISLFRLIVSGLSNPPRMGNSGKGGQSQQSHTSGSGKTYNFHNCNFKDTNFY